MGRGVRFALALFLLSLASSAVHANAPIAQVSGIAPITTSAAQPKKKTLIVGSEQDYPPFATGMTDATAGGFTVELWKAVAAEAGLDYTIRVRPFHQLLQEFKDGKIDVLINLAQSDERRLFADFTALHVVVHGAIFVRKGESGIRSEGDLATKSIIVLRADLAHDYAVSKGWQKQLVLVDTSQDGLRLLASGKHDAMLLSKLSGMQTLQAQGIKNVEPLKVKAGFSQKFAFAVHKGQSGLLSELNEGLALTKSNRKYDELYEKWFAPYEVHEIGFRDLIKYIGPMMLIFLTIGGYTFYRRQAERRQAEYELSIAASAFESQDGIMVTDANSSILRVNKAFTAITGYSAEEVAGQNPRILKSGRQDDDFYSAMWETLGRNGSWAGEIWNRRKNGEIYPESLTITAVKDKDGVVTNYVASLADITQRKDAEAKIESLAFFDPLTGLPNRRLLLDRLQQAVASSARSGHHGALLFIDLDNFKSLNDTLGHDVGDLLLQQVAQRLKTCVREGDTVARLGGDEFVVVLEDLSMRAPEAAAQTEAVVEKVFGALHQPYWLDDHEHRNTPSIGATLFSNKHSGLEDIMKQADIAMYQAKKAGRNTLRFFDPVMQSMIAARVALEIDLRRAVSEQEQFQLYYQPQVDSTGQMLGVEALARWKHPARGMVSPADFIPLAEESGLILPLGHWVLTTACLQLANWAEKPETARLTMAVNISAKQFGLPTFVEEVLALVDHFRIDPARLKLEITESMLASNVEELVAKMSALKSRGINFSMDDFGTGYSSLQYLKRLPLDQLKIDQSFVRDIAADSSDRAIVKTVIAMARSLDLDVIAEGVETEEQRRILLKKGCTRFQGYLFGKPVPIEQFDARSRHSPIVPGGEVDWGKIDQGSMPS